MIKKKSIDILKWLQEEIFIAFGFLSWNIEAIQLFSFYKPQEFYCSKILSDKKRIILVGNSSFSCTVHGGQGLNHSVLDAYKLIWRIYLILNGYFGLNFFTTI